MAKRYGDIESGDWVHFPRGGILIACCDCDLVHELRPKVLANGRVMVKVIRNDRSTSALRRAAKKPKRAKRA